MSNRFSNLSGLKRHRVAYWMFNLIMLAALLAFALRG